MLIKNLAVDDYMRYRSDIRRLLIDSYRDDYNGSYTKIIRLIDKKLDDLDNFIKTNATVVGAINDGHLLGFTWIYQYVDEGEKRFHFNEIVVDSDYRGMRIGEKLANESLEMARKTGAKIIDLMVAEDNLASRKLSEKQGFKTNKRYLVKRL